MAKQDDVERVLKDVKLAISQGKFYPITRTKNLKTLAKMGITWEDAKDEIYELTLSNYVKGPMKDRDFPDTDLFWVFKKQMNGQLIYIKFKILYSEDSSLKLVSFHIDEM